MLEKLRGLNLLIKSSNPPKLNRKMRRKRAAIARRKP